MDCEALDIIAEIQWKPKEWLRYGKQYLESYNLPLEVIETQENLLTIPEKYDKLLPSPNLTVNQFLQLKLRTIGGDLIMGKPLMAYRFKYPKGDISWLASPSHQLHISSNLKRHLVSNGSMVSAPLSTYISRTMSRSLFGY